MSSVAKSVSSVEGLPQGVTAQESFVAKISSSLLDGVGTASLWVIIFVVPFTMAGIRETGVGLFVGCSLIMSVAWAIRELISPSSGSAFSRIYIVLFCGIALVTLQLVSLPQWLTSFASPFARQYLDVLNNGHVLLEEGSAWNRLSFTPSLTRSGLVLLIAYVLFFMTLAQRLVSLSAIDHLLRLLAIATVFMAALGLAQLFFGNGKFLWVIEHPFRNASWPAKGTFTNQNHFAHFLALGVGPLVWWWRCSGQESSSRRVRSTQRNQFGAAKKSSAGRFAVGGLIAIVLLAGLLSFSRGGIGAILIALTFAIVAMGKSLSGLLKLAAPVVTFVVIAVALFGTKALEAEWSTLARAESLSSLSRGRFALWASLLDALPHFWLFGSGVGSHAEVYPIWLPTDFGVRFSHAESGYFQILIETGIAGLLLLLVGIGIAGRWAHSALKAAGENKHRRSRVLILTAGLVVSVLHSAVDFAWYIPACMVFTTIILACLFRTSQLYAPSAGNTSWPSNLALIVLLAAIPLSSLSADVSKRDMTSEASWSAFRFNVVEAGRTKIYDSLDGVNNRLELMVSDLEECLRNDPTDYRAMSELATLYLSRFESTQETTDNPMSLREIKNTVEPAGFESGQEVRAWLKVAFGEHVDDLYRSLWMAEKAITGQPLKGDNYLTLAQVGFLKGISESEERRLIAQSIRLRPHSAPILYFAGLVEAEKGDVEAACKWWKQAFHLVSAIRPRILRDLEKFLPPEEIVHHIDPGPDALWMMFESYRQQKSTERQVWTATYYGENFGSLSASVDSHDSLFWRRSAEIFQSIDDQKQAVKCLGRAVQFVPGDYPLRKKYAFSLLAVGKTQIARRELQWCRLKSPHDAEVVEQLRLLDVPEGREVLHGEY